MDILFEVWAPAEYHGVENAVMKSKRLVAYGY